MQERIKSPLKKKNRVLTFVWGKYGLNKLEIRKIMVKNIGKRIVKIKGRESNSELETSGKIKENKNV